jgi:hypothetical protein
MAPTNGRESADLIEALRPAIFLISVDIGSQRYTNVDVLHLDQVFLADSAGHRTDTAANHGG